MKKNNLIDLFPHILIPLIIIIYTISYHLGTKGPIIDSEKTYLLITPLTYLINILALFIIYTEIKKYFKKEIKTEKENIKISFLRNNKKIILGLVSFIYLLVINLFGFVLSTVAMLAISMWLLGVRNKKLVFILSPLMSIGLFIIFQIILGVRLPMGIFEKWRYLFYF